MGNLDARIIKLVRSLLASQGTIVGGRDSSAVEMASAMKEIAETGFHERVEPALASDVQKVLIDNLPEVDELENWLLYTHDFSGITSYLTKGGSLAHAKIIRNIDMTNIRSYEKCYLELKVLVELKQKKSSPELIKKAEDELKSLLPGNRIKYMHWIGSKPSKEEVAALAKQSENSSFE